MIELYLLIRFLILEPLGLVKPDPNAGREKRWLKSIGFDEYYEEKRHKKKSESLKT